MVSHYNAERYTSMNLDTNRNSFYKKMIIILRRIFLENTAVLEMYVNIEEKLTVAFNPCAKLTTSWTLH